MKEQLYLYPVDSRRELVDIKSGSKVNRTIVSNDLSSVTLVRSSFSSTITLYKTLKNLSILDFISTTGNQSTKPYEKIRCDYYYDGIEVFTNGYATISKVDDNSISLNVYDGVITLQEELKSKTLNDINKSELIHTLNVSEWESRVQGSVANKSLPFVYGYGAKLSGRKYVTELNETEVDDIPINTPDYYASIIKNGVVSYFPSMPLEDQFPYISHNWILDKIVSEAGFQIDPFSSIYKNLRINIALEKEYIALSEGYFQRDYSDPLQRRLLGQNIETTTGSLGENESIKEATDSNQQVLKTIPFSTSEIENDLMALNGDGEITCKFSGNFILNYAVNLDFSIGDQVRAVVIQLRNGVEVDSDDLIPQLNARPDNNSRPRVNNIDNKNYTLTKEFSCIEDDVFKIVLRGYTITSFGFRYLTINNFEVDFTANAYSSSIVYPTVDTYNLGKIKQSTFLIDMCNRYGLFMSIDPNNRTIKFTSIDEIISNRRDAVDMSDKFVRIVSESYNKTYGKENLFKYKYSDSNQDYNDGSFSVDSEFANNEVELYESPFTVYDKIGDDDYDFNNYHIINGEEYSTSKVNELNEVVSDGVLRPNYKADIQKDTLLVRMESEFIPNVKGSRGGVLAPDYIGFSNKVSSTYSKINTNVKFVPYPPISLQESLDRFYGGFKDIANRYKSITVEMFLSSLDLRELDTSKLIYLKQTQAYYYVNKVKYAASDITALFELVEIPADV